MPHSTPHSHHSKPIRQFVATRRGGPFQIITTDYPQPGPDEICIRNRAVGLNPVDLDEEIDIRKEYPASLGTDVAGVVEVVGSQVTAFKVGDAVMATCDGDGGGEGGKYAAFQDITTVCSESACRKPVSWTFAEAASAPCVPRFPPTPAQQLTPCRTAYLTACMALSSVLHVPLPHLLPRPHPQTPNTDPSSEYITALRPPSPSRRRPLPPKTPPPALTSVLVLGGSSAFGAAAIQLLRLSLPEETPIISTNPTAHKAWVTGVLGATACVDGRGMADEELVAAVRALTPGGKGVDGVVDAVGELDRDHGHGDGFWGFMIEKGKPEGRPSRVYSCGPEGATWQTSSDIFDFHVRHLPEAMRGLGELVDEGRYKLPLEVEVVGKGLEGVAGGLEKLRAGVSGKVLVVAL